MNFQILSEALGWTVLHSVWQGLLLYLVYLGVRYLMRHHAPQGRYLTALMTLGALCLLAGITFYQYLPDQGLIVRASISDEATHIPMVWPEPSPEPTEITWKDRLEEALPLIGWAWVLGVMVMLIRWGGSLFSLYQLRNNGLQEAPGEWKFFVNNWTSEWRIRRTVNVWLSEKATAPLTIGYLRPIILIPLSLVPDLTPEQWEAILLHELAHIRRADYLIRLIQSLIEILFFYHPLVAWLSKEIAREREACCDDQAVAACGDALEYAQALTTLQRMCNHPQTSIAMSTQSYPGNFSTRIKRLFSHTPQPGTPRATLLMLGLFMTCLVSFGWANRPEPDPIHQTQQGDFFLTIDRSYNQQKMEELIAELEREDIKLSVEGGMWTEEGELDLLLANITFPDGLTAPIFGESISSITVIREAGAPSLSVCVIRNEAEVKPESEPPFSLLIDRTYTQEKFRTTVSQLKEQGITLATQAAGWNEAGELSSIFGSITFEDGVSKSFEILHLDTLYIHREPGAKDFTIATVSQDKEGFYLTLDRTYSPERLDKLVEELKSQNIDLNLIAVGWDENNELNDLVADITFPDGKSTNFEARGLKHVTILNTKEEGLRVLISQKGPIEKHIGEEVVSVENVAVQEIETEERGASFGIGLGPSTTRESWEAMVEKFAADGLTFDIEQISFTKTNALWGIRGTVTYLGQTNAFELGPDEIGVLLISKDRFEFPKKQIAKKSYDVEGITLEIGPSMTLDELKALPRTLDWQGVEVILESAQADCDGFIESAKGTFILEDKSASFDIHDGVEKAIVKIGNDNGITIDIRPAEREIVEEELPVVEGRPAEEVLDESLTEAQPVKIRNAGGTEPLYVVNGVIVPADSIVELEPAGIDHINVLKGPTANEAYGEKGANGVVEIYTKGFGKKGKEDKEEEEIVEMPETGGAYVTKLKKDGSQELETAISVTTYVVDGDSMDYERYQRLGLTDQDIYTFAFIYETAKTVEGEGPTFASGGTMEIQTWKNRLEQEAAQTQEVTRSFGLTARPNPFQEEVKLDFSSETETTLTVQIFDLQGKVITKIAQDEPLKGTLTLSWKPEGIPAGVYLVRAMAGEETLVQRITWNP